MALLMRLIGPLFVLMILWNVYRMSKRYVETQRAISEFSSVSALSPSEERELGRLRKWRSSFVRMLPIQVTSWVVILYGLYRFGFY